MFLEESTILIKVLRQEKKLQCKKLKLNLLWDMVLLYLLT